jgi:hypothetical protein
MKSEKALLDQAIDAFNALRFANSVIQNLAKTKQINEAVRIESSQPQTEATEVSKESKPVK